MSLLSLAVLGACGSRTGLLVPGDEEASSNRTAPWTRTTPARLLDAGTDATEDVAELRDALPPIDVT